MSKLKCQLKLKVQITREKMTLEKNGKLSQLVGAAFSHEILFNFDFDIHLDFGS
jgi:hypothetical protein